MKVKINALGHDHSVVAVTYMNLGTLEMYRENSEKSLAYDKEASEILEVIYYFNALKTGVALGHTDTIFRCIVICLDGFYHGRHILI